MGKRDYMRNPQHWIKLAPKISVAYITTTNYEVYKVKINPADTDIVGKYRWYMKDGYAITSIQYKRVKMHHLIMGKPSKDREIDHIDRDRLNNRRDNLRFVTHAQNQKNRRDGKGYRFTKGKWEAYIQNDGKQIYLGRFTTEKEAKNAHLKAKSRILKTLEV